MKDGPLLLVNNAQVAYSTRGLFRKSDFNAVDGVSLEIDRGETLALVGESGCGKSTLGRAIMGLMPVASGSIEFEGNKISGMPEHDMRPFRQRLQMIFQDNYSALDPRFTAIDSTTEPMRAFGVARTEAKSAAAELLSNVGLSDSLSHRRPSRLSGGQRQRVGIARALASNPDLIVADEPVSALDVSVQAQVLNLLKKQQNERRVALLFISHDLRAVKFMADRIAVMYLGRIVETGPAREVISDPKHPYTQALVSASSLNAKRERIVLRGELPSLISPPAGCRFHTRCPVAIRECNAHDRSFVQINGHHSAACLLLTK